MTTINYRPAVRTDTPLIVGIAGPSGGGKTLSALRLATGLAGGRPVLMINTNGPVGHLYADEFAYSAYDIAEPPYSAERYEEAIKAAAALNPGCIIIDSMSDVHESEGGLLDAHEREMERLTKNWAPGRDPEAATFSAWIKPKAAEARMIYTMSRQACSFVLCFRAKEKLKILKGKNPVPMGWQPIASDRLQFESLLMFVLPPGAEGVPDYDERAAKRRKPLLPILERFAGQPISEALGRSLAAWSTNSTDKRSIAERIAAVATLDELRALYGSVDAAPHKAQFAARKKELESAEGPEVAAPALSSDEPPTFNDAVKALDRRDYDLAADIARSLPDAEREEIEQKITRRLAA